MSVIARKGTIAFIGAICVLSLIFMGMGYSQHYNQHITQTKTSASSTTNVTGLPGYNISVFAKGTTSYLNPDSVEVDGKYIFVGYQNITATDGSDGKSSTIVQYTLQGAVVHKYSVLGHCDGLRLDPYTHLIWATSNEDANPRLVTIDPSTSAMVSYQFPPTPHKGGYDDLAFVNGMAFIAASNPTLNSAGVNTAPAVGAVTLSNGTATVTPVLYGNATALDTTTNQQVTLNLTDPDSMTIDPEGDLVLVSQADAELIFLHHPGTSQQTVTRVPLGTQVDDTIWIPSAKGHLLIVDGKQNTIYAVSMKGGFTPGTVYTEAPSDSGVAGFVGTVALTTGTITPAIIGLTSPTGLTFAPAK